MPSNRQRLSKNQSASSIHCRLRPTCHAFSDTFWREKLRCARSSKTLERIISSCDPRGADRSTEWPNQQSHFLPPRYLDEWLLNAKPEVLCLLTGALSDWPLNEPNTPEPHKWMLTKKGWQKSTALDQVFWSSNHTNQMMTKFKRAKISPSGHKT